MLLADVPADLKRTVRENWYAELGYTPKLGQRLIGEALDAGKRHIGYFTPNQDGKCLAEKQLVYARSGGIPGLMTIHKLADSFSRGMVCELPGSNGVWKRIRTMEKQPKQRLLILTFRDGSTIEVTKDHQFPVNGILISAENLRTGDIVDNGLGMLPEEQGLADHEIAWAAGLFLADGCFPDRSTGDDCPYLTWYACHESEAEELAGRLALLVGHFGGTVRTYPKAGSHGVTIAVNSRVFRAAINTFVDGVGSEGKHFARAVWAQNNKFLEAMVRGYLSGDGSETHGGISWDIGFTAKNTRFPDDLRLACIRLGWRFRITRRSVNAFGKIHHAWRGYISTAPRLKDRSPFILENITGSHGEKISWEITIDPDHLYILPNGIVTHNSYGISKLAGSFLCFPEVRGWIIAPKYEDGSKEFLYIWDDLAKTGLLRTAKSKHQDVRGGNMRIELKSGSWVQVVSAQDQENLRREQLDFVIYAEASKLPENLHDKYMYARVERRRGLVFYPTTHKGHGWCYDDVYCRSIPVQDRTFEWGPWVNDRRERIGGAPNERYDPDYYSCQVSYVPEFGDVLHHGEYTPEQIEKARKRLLPQHFAEQFGGEAVSYAGLVYPFDRTIHKVPRFAIPPHWTHVVGYDHGAGGGSDPTAIEVGSYGPDGTLYWWGEIYDQTQTTIQTRGSRLKVLLNGRVPSYIMTGRDSKQVITELRQIGLTASCPPDWSVEARIIRTAELIGLKRWVILEGCCPNLEREIGQYEWDEKNPGKPRDGNDHCLEAAGYASLAPIRLPDADTAQPDETPESRAERFRAERLWSDYRREQQEEISAGARHYDAILERPRVVEEYIAR